MLKKLRENMKMILWITIIAFVGLIFLAWGMDIQSGRGPSPGTIAKVNGYTVTAGELESATRSTFEAYRGQFGRMPSDAEADALREQAWNSLVQQILLTQEAEERGMTATDEEVVYSVRMDPPQFVRSQEIFQTNGQFDPAKFREYLSDPLMDWSALENYVRATLPVSKLQDLITWGAKVSQSELKEAYDMANERRTISYIFVDPLSFQMDESEIAEAKLREYYNSNQETFTEPERAMLRYVFLELTPSAADSNEVLADLARILGDIRDGEDFAEMARIHSEDPSAEEGGGTDAYYKKGDLRGKLEEVLFSMEVGEVSEPFVDPSGYHIVKLEDKTTVDDVEQIQFRQILRSVSPSQGTINLLWERAQRIEAATLEGTALAEAVSAEGLEVTETPYFVRGGFVPGLSGLPRAQEMAFEMTQGEVRGPITNYRGHYFIELAELRAERLKPFEEAEEQCRRMVLDEMRAEMAHEEALALHNSLATAGGLEQVAEAESLEVKSAGPYNRSGYIPGVGRDHALLGMTFAASQEDPPFVVRGVRGSYVVRVDLAERSDPVAFEREKQALAQRTLSQKQGRAYTTWMTDLQESAEINDFRERY
jgi:peptidyl-prolyl cis-trans isomerase D